MPPSRVPNKGPPTPSRFPSQSSLRERETLLLEPPSSIFQSPWLMSPLPGSPAGPQWTELPTSRTFSTYPPGSPVKDSHLQVPLRERCSTSRAPFIHLAKSLVNEPTSRFPSRAPMERGIHLQSLFYITLIHLSMCLVHEPPFRFSSRVFMERDACHQSLPLHNLQGPQ